MIRLSIDLSAAVVPLLRSDENLLSFTIESYIILKLEIPDAVCTLVELRPLGAL